MNESVIHKIRIDENTILVVKSRFHDWIAYVDNNHGIWEAGSTWESALAKLVWTLFGEKE